MESYIGVHWFRKGLRLHDNPSLKYTLEKCSKVFPIFIWDPFFAKNNFSGPNRWRFLIESLADLDANLRKHNSRLFVLRGNPKDIIPKILSDWKVNLLSFEEDTEPYAKNRDSFVKDLCLNNNVEICSKPSHTLFDLNFLFKMNGDKICTTYASFTALLDRAGLPNTPIHSKLVFPDMNDNELFDPNEYKLPTLIDDCFIPENELSSINTEKSSMFPGGETAALIRLKKHIGNAKWICTFEKPDTSPNSLEPSTTVLSPYLKFGCLSVRLFYESLREVYASGTKRAENWGMRQVTLEGQLIWREFYYFCAAFTPNFDKIANNPICRQIKWDHNDEFISAWKESRTGFPFIDAIMNQLRIEGWIHHLARHAVACFLTRGDLYQSWEVGAKIFEYYLLDADWSLNNGNWMWLSASAFFHQYFRVYSPVAFGKKTDPEGNYIRKYVPQLGNFPSKFIYEPWSAPLSIQKEANCIVGIDYPKPIVDHQTVSKENMKKIKVHFSKSNDLSNSSKKRKI
jgi:cryptochrome